MDAGTISIYLNGEPRQVESGKTVLEQLEFLRQPLQGSLVEHNGRALLRSEWLATQVLAGDRLEILRVVAGG
jgi:thiamine biosynthesis protein ThiS